MSARIIEFPMCATQRSEDSSSAAENRIFVVIPNDKPSSAEPQSMGTPMRVAIFAAAVMFSVIGTVLICGSAGVVGLAAAGFIVSSVTLGLVPAFLGAGVQMLINGLVCAALFDKGFIADMPSFK